MGKPLWDIFCQVIDNWGDVGICWRLARQLQQRNIDVRLWIDDPSALSWMQPCAKQTNIQIYTWNENARKLAAIKPGDVLIEAFGCRAPAPILQQLVANTPSPPVWVNLEYLSAQAYAERNHGLASPQQNGPAKGQICWFFYPGFTPPTGGLLREQHLDETQRAFNTSTWLKYQKIPEIKDVLRVSLFCYENLALPSLIEQWQNSTQPVHLLVTPGISTSELRRILGLGESTAPTQTCQTQRIGQLVITWLPFLSQTDFDHLLWSSHLNFVRGEDSWIRAIWANRPFIWQPYIQDDGEHHHKLQSFLELVSDAPQWADFERQWTQQASPNWAELLSTLNHTKTQLKRLRTQLMQQPDLVSSLIAFVREKTQVHVKKNC